MNLVTAAGAALVLAVLLMLTGCARSDDATSERVRMYTCPKHPDVVLPRPGQCPKCGELLVPVQGVPTATGAVAVRAPDLDVPRQ